jgi:hypothetical protein
MDGKGRGRILEGNANGRAWAVMSFQRRSRPGGIFQQQNLAAKVQSSLYK